MKEGCMGMGSMTRFKVGEKVTIVGEIPGFSLHQGTIAGITEPFVTDERSKDEALRELRLYEVRLDDGRQFRFRGRELLRSQLTERLQVSFQ
jgi:hypothetical protein